MGSKVNMFSRPQGALRDPQVALRGPSGGPQGALGGKNSVEV